METNEQDFRIDWERKIVRYRDIEVEFTSDWLQALRRKIGDPWCPSGDPVPCKCWDLVHLNGDVTGYPLEALNHVSTMAAEITCESYVREVLHRSPFGKRDCVPVPVVGDLWTAPTSLHDEYEGYESDQLGWPIPIQSSPYGLIISIREWVEDSPDDKLRAILHQDSRMPYVLQELSGEEVWNDVDYSSSYDYWFGFNKAMTVLERWGFPATLTTAKYFLAERGVLQRRWGELANVKDLCAMLPPAPARGVCVYSFGFLPVDHPMREGMMLQEMVCSPSWRSDDLDRRACKVAKKHFRWWQSLPCSRISRFDLRKFNGAKGDALEPYARLFAKGELSQSALYEKAFAHYGAQSPLEKADVRRKLSDRLYRLKTRIDQRP